MDPDWKPERRSFVQVQEAIHNQLGRPNPSENLSLNLQPIPTVEIYQGCMGIVELEPSLPKFQSRFVVILDNDKHMRRFPFGRLESEDTSTSQGAERETREEIGIEIRCDEESYVGTIDFGNCLFHIFTNKVPAYTPITLGEEQEEWGAPTADEIDSWVASGQLAPRHASSWKLFKQKRLSVLAAAELSAQK
jgi:hypothetical protein